MLQSHLNQKNALIPKAEHFSILFREVSLHHRCQSAQRAHTGKHIENEKLWNVQFLSETYMCHTPILSAQGFVEKGDKDNEHKMAHDYKEIVFSKHIKAGAHYRLTVRWQHAQEL